MVTKTSYVAYSKKNTHRGAIPRNYICIAISREYKEQESCNKKNEKKEKNKGRSETDRTRCACVFECVRERESQREENERVNIECQGKKRGKQERIIWDMSLRQSVNRKGREIGWTKAEREEKSY